MKNMLSQEDISQVREIVREEVDNSPRMQRIGNAVADLVVRVSDLEGTTSEIRQDTKKILSGIDAFVKKNSDLEIEQKSHAAELSRHEAWIQKANKKLKISH